MQKIRELAEKYSHDELGKCIDQQIREGKNACFTGENGEETINVLSKASYIKQLIEEGRAESVTEAIRRLAASMRSLQQGRQT